MSEGGLPVSQNVACLVAEYHQQQAVQKKLRKVPAVPRGALILPEVREQFVSRCGSVEADLAPFRDMLANLCMVGTKAAQLHGAPEQVLEVLQRLSEGTRPLFAQLLHIERDLARLLTADIGPNRDMSREQLAQSIQEISQESRGMEQIASDWLERYVVSTQRFTTSVNIGLYDVMEEYMRELRVLNRAYPGRAVATAGDSLGGSDTARVKSDWASCVRENSKKRIERVATVLHSLEVTILPLLDELAKLLQGDSSNVSGAALKFPSTQE